MQLVSDAFAALLDPVRTEQYFQNASGGSVGDPHLSFNGKTWDNMGSQPDLLHSDSIPGGYPDLDANDGTERERRDVQSVGDDHDERRCHVRYHGQGRQCNGIAVRT